jgi:outer membrane protein assembly complex protein YaeT
MVRRPGLALLLLIALGGSSAHATDKMIARWLRRETPPRIDSISVSFEGEKHFTADEIKSHLYARTADFWRTSIKQDRRTRVQRETLQRDTLEIKYLYLTNGFLNVRVEESFEPLEPDSNALVRVVIDEGHQYKYGTGELDGEFDRSYRPRFKNMMDQLMPGTPINPFRMREIGDQMKTVLANDGFPYAVVKYSVDTTGSPASCPFTYHVTSDKLVHFGEVTLQRAVPEQNVSSRRDTARYYPDYVGLRELTMKAGAKYRRKDILESQRRLFESGYYKTFQFIQSKDSIDRLNPRFILQVRERKPGFVTVRTGFGQSATRDLVLNFSGSFGTRNFLGSRQLEGTADYSVETQRARRLLLHRYRVRGTEPWLFGVRMKLILTGEYQPKLRDAVRDFDKESWTLSAALAKQFGTKIKTEVGFQYESVDISGIPLYEIPLIKEQEGISARRKLYVSLFRDSRDNQFFATKGAVTDLSGEYFGGFLKGDESFFKILASWSRYQIFWPLGPGTVYAYRLRGAWAAPFDGTQVVPLDEALYLGGANTVRGFPENKLGPLLPDGTPEGARYTLVFNQELRFASPFQPFVQLLPLIGGLFEKFPLRNSLFIDAGNGFRNEKEIRLDNIAVSYGAGVQISTPAGPVRIDYGQVLKTREFAPIHRWHFTILYAF